MKKYFFLIWIAIMAINVNSQNYHKLIRTNKFWDVYSLGWYDYNAIDKIFFTGNDTIIEGNIYQLSRQYPYEPVNPGYLIPPFFIDTNSISTNEFLREDTIMKKVYIYDPYMTPTDQLLYDFSLSAGDTLKSGYNKGIFGDSLILTSIDSVTLLNGEIRKRFIFDNPIYSEYGYYIEGIGGDQGLFSPIVPAFEQNEQLGYFCISQDGINLWGDQCNWYFVGINNLREDKMITIFPNPAHDNFHVNLFHKVPIADFIITDLLGTEILHENLTHPDNVISISELLPGIYIYRIKSGQFTKQDKIIIF